MTSKNAIFVTGSHRSGTTWVGQTIAASPSVVYFHEPFNLDRPIKERWVPAQHQFTYISRENEQPFYSAIGRLLDWRLYPNGHIRAARTPRAFAAQTSQRLKLLRYRLAGARALIKDPLAVLSAPWLATRFDMQVVVMIRHPAAFASSVKLFNWQHPFSHFLSQPLLMRDYLYPFESEIKDYVAVEHSVLDQAAFLWELIYYVIQKYVEQYPRWIFVRHEDLSREPVAGFRAILDRLDLEWSPAVADYIRAQSLVSDTTDQSQRNPYDLKRNSLANISHWKTRLTPAEIDRVKSQVQAVSQNFYSEADW